MDDIGRVQEDGTLQQERKIVEQMPRSHKAFVSTCLLQKLPLKPESIASWQSRLFIGTSDGVLLVYEVQAREEGNNPTGVPTYRATIKESKKSFCKTTKSIQQLEVVDSLTLLLSLSDGVVCVHGLGGFQFLEQVGRGKHRGAHLFYVQDNGSECLVFLAIKKKVVMFKWRERQFSEEKEFMVPDFVKTMSYFGHKLCLGFKREYALLDVVDGSLVELFPTGRLQMPVSCTLPEDENNVQDILLSRDNLGVTINQDGKPTRQYPLDWTSAPHALNFISPYVVACTQKYVEIHTLHATKKDNRIQLLEVPDSQLISIGESSPASPLGCIYVASSTHRDIYRLDAVPFDVQIRDLVEQESFEEALSLCHVSGIPTSECHSTSKAINTLYAAYLFEKRDYENAMLHLEESDAELPIVLTWIPKFFSDLLHTLWDQHGHKVQNKEPNSSILTSKTPHVTAEVYGDELKQVVRAFIPYLTCKRVPFLGDEHLQSMTDSDRALAALVDTCLLKCYLFTNQSPTLVDTFMKIPNFCPVNEAENLLLSANMRAGLVTFYEGKELHKEAIDLLVRIAREDLAVLTNAKKDKINSTVAPIVTYATKIDASTFPDAGAYGALILRAAEAVFRLAGPELGLQLFRESGPVEPQAVLQFLSSKAAEHVVPYLAVQPCPVEYVIFETNSTNPELHNMLVQSYLDKVCDLMQQKAKLQKSKESGTNAEEQKKITQQISQVAEDTERWRDKLYAFIKSSQFYGPEKVLSKFVAIDGLYRERAILLGRLRQHSHVLNIYAHKLKDYKLATEYCDSLSRAEAEEVDIYMMLYRIYLTPPDKGDEANTKQATRLLTKKSSHMDTAVALGLLPLSMPASNILQFFETQFRDVNERRKYMQMEKSIRRSALQEVREERVALLSRMVRIVDDTQCAVCKKRITMSVFNWYPNGTIAHFSCSPDKKVCPVTGRNFEDELRKENVLEKDHQRQGSSSSGSPTPGGSMRRLPSSSNSMMRPY